MVENRRFSRVECNEKIFLKSDNGNVEARILDISLKGVLVEFADDIFIRKGDKCEMTLKLENSDVMLQVSTEVVHNHKNLVGVKFVHIDLESMIHLRSLLEARTANPQQISDEFAFLRA